MEEILLALKIVPGDELMTWLQNTYQDLVRDVRRVASNMGQVRFGHLFHFSALYYRYQNRPIPDCQQQK